MMTLKLAIWDMDGTIVDSRDVISAAMDEAFGAAGFAPPGYARTRQTVGLGLEEACRRLAPADIAPGDLSRIVAAYREAFIAQRARPDFVEPLYAGARETLHRLAEENWLIAMATGKSRRGVEALFEMHPLRDYFDTIHCADDGPGKPHPFMVEAALRALGAEAEDALIIGDAVHDIAMGLSAGVHTIGVSWGFGEAHELEAAGAHEVHHDYPALNGALDAFGARFPAE